MSGLSRVKDTRDDSRLVGMYPTTGSRIVAGCMVISVLLVILKFQISFMQN
jgi:hypothetical protein